MGMFAFKELKRDKKSWIKKISILVMWLILWQIAACLADNDILLAGPVDVGKTLGRLLVTREFYKICLNSMGRILAGFFLAFAMGMLLGGLSYAFPLADELFKPLVSVLKSIPVASFVVLLLIWQGSENLSVWVSFFVVFPNACTSMKNGLKAVDFRLLEMADIFRIHGLKRFLYIYRPTLVLFLLSGMEICVGMAFKSGVAAEVIGVPDFSIGERIYISKVYLDTPGLFAWTIALILLSFFAERLILKGMSLLLGPAKKYKGGDWQKNSIQNVNSQGNVDLKDNGNVDKRYADKRYGDKEYGYKEYGDKENKNTVVLSHICKAFGEKEVLSDVSREIKKGGRYILMGPSGSGKTTLLRIIAGLEQADSGEIKGRPKTAFLFQEDRLLEKEFTITNIMLTTSGGGKRNIRESCKEEEIRYGEAIKELLPESCFYLPVYALSGGMKRRCALARTLFYEMDNEDVICLLDEPFSGLDEETKRKTAAFIKKYLKGRTLIVATHDEKDAELLGGRIWNVKKSGLL